MSDITLSLDRLLHRAREITGAQMGNVQCLERGALRICVQHGFKKPFLQYFDAVDQGSSACGAALRSLGNVVVEDVEASAIYSPGSLETMLQAGARAVQSTPIFAANRALVGILSTHHDRPRAFSSHEMARIEAVATQAGPLLEDLAKVRSEAYSAQAQTNNRIALEGEWDLARKDELARLFASLAIGQPATIDLSNCPYADSTVLAQLALLKRKFDGVPVTLVAPQTQMKRLLQVVGYDELFHIVDEA